MHLDKSGKITLKSTSEVNMSNWQITNTINNFTMINNKFDILYKLNNLLNNNINPKDIFIMSKSYNYSTSYITYFEHGNIISNELNNLIKIVHLGKIIPLHTSNHINQINCLFDLYRHINSIMNKNLKCRLRSNSLQISFDALFSHGLESSLQLLVDLSIQQINEFYEHLIIVTKKKSMIIKSIQHKYEHILKSNANNTSSDTFIQSFNRIERPVIGLFDNASKSFKIINADQIYKNGEEAVNGIKLTNVSKNSPVNISFIGTGLMLGAVSYLAYRQHTVNKETIENKMVSMPQNNEEVIDAIFTDDKNKHNIDPLIHDLAVSNLEKLEKTTHKININIDTIDTERNSDNTQ